MSSAANHRKRSHRSEQRKGTAFRASARRAYYTQMPRTQRMNIFTRFFSKVIKKKETRNPTDDNI